MFKTIYKHLKNKGFDCYSIGQHKDICEKEYVVIKNYTPSASSKVLLDEKVELFLFYPIGIYTKAIEFVENIRLCMSELDLEDNYSPLPIVIDDSKQAYTTRLSYKNTRKRVL